MRKIFVLILFIVSILGACGSQESIKDKTKKVQSIAFLNEGSGKFTFSDYEPFKNKSMEVYYYRPEKLPADAPVLFVMHGTLRNADTYRDNWVSLADKYKVLIVVPQFTKNNFPGSRSYNYGNLLNEDKELVDEKDWSYSLLDPIFDYLISKTGMDTKDYDVFGHSAGSQFVHRLLLFKGKTKAQRLVTSNAGTYTMPDFDVDFPYGLKGMGYLKERLKEVFSEKLVVQLGKEDNNPKHKYLNTSKKALQQGENRYERGQSFYKKSKTLAEQENMKFNWVIRTVSGVGHNNGKMAIDAAEYLYEGRN